MAKEAVKIQQGLVVDYTATKNLSNGEVVPLSEGCGVALNNASTGDVISLELAGVFEIKADDADTISFGKVVYFDHIKRVVTTRTDTVGDGTGDPLVKAGIAVSEKSASTAGTVLVKIG